jgi:hypothetical protein
MYSEKSNIDKLRAAGAIVEGAELNEEDAERINSLTPEEFEALQELPSPTKKRAREKLGATAAKIKHHHHGSCHGVCTPPAPLPRG